jgi:glycosyltransferase involved in cell wall biosynthesis
VGAEGLAAHPPQDIRIGDTPEQFASACVALLSDRKLGDSQADAAWRMVSSRFSWEQVARRFDDILRSAPGLSEERDLQAVRL